MLIDLLASQPPTDFWHDPFIQFVIYVAVAIIVGIATVIATIWVFRKQRSKKELTYQIISDAPIASVTKGLENQVTILFKGHPVENARQVVIKIRNSGNVAVKRDDYDEPIKLVFEGKSDIIGSDILNTEPENLIDSIDKATFIKIEAWQLDINSVKLEKFLLNPQQSITMTFLLNGAYKQLNVRGRIIDGEIVKYLEPERPYTKWTTRGGIFYVFGALIFWWIGHVTNFVIFYIMAGLVIVIMYYLFFFLGSSLSRRR